MKRKMFIISLIVILLSLSSTSANASTYTDDYPYPSAPVCPNNCTVDDWNMYKRECTSFAAHKTDQLIGDFMNGMTGPNGAAGTFGNGGNWNDNAEDIGFLTSSTPQENAVLVIEPSKSGAGPVGHVAVVAKVYENSNIDIIEYNWSPNAKSFHERINVASDKTGYSYIVFSGDTCSIPTSGLWEIDSKCTIDGNSKIAPDNVKVTSQGILEIINNGSLDIDFTSKGLYIESGGKLLVESGSLVN